MNLLAIVDGGITITTGAALAIGSGAVSAITALFWMLIKSKEREYERIVAGEKEAKENYEKLAAEALGFATQQANWAMAQSGLPPVVPVAPVVPRSQSPSSAKQREEARLQTMVANLAQLKLMTGMQARPIPPRAPQPEAQEQRENALEEAISPTQTLAAPVSAVTATAKLAKAIDAVPLKTAVEVVKKLDEQKQAEK